MTVEFVEMPPAAQGRAESPRNLEIAEQLQANPNVWAKVATDEASDGLAVRIRTGRAKTFATGKWEAKSRRNGDGLIDIYARYVEETHED